MRSAAIKSKESPREQLSKSSRKMNRSTKSTANVSPREKKVAAKPSREAAKIPAVALAPLLETDDPVKKAIIARVTRVMANVLRDSTSESLQSALEAPTDAGSAAHLLSMASLTEEAVRALDPTASAILRGARMKEDLLQRAGGVLETAQVAELLGISRQAVLKRVQSRKLLALPDASQHLRFPVLQFTDTGTIKGFDRVLSAFNVESPWTQLAVLLDTDEAVGDTTIIDALRAGKLEAVLDVVRSFGA